MRPNYENNSFPANQHQLFTSSYLSHRRENFKWVIRLPEFRTPFNTHVFEALHMAVIKVYCGAVLAIWLSLIPALFSLIRCIFVVSKSNRLGLGNIGAQLHLPMLPVLLQVLLRLCSKTYNDSKI